MAERYPGGKRSDTAAFVLPEPVDDPGAYRGALAAGLLLAAAVAWFASGFIWSTGDPGGPAAADPGGRISVAVIDSVAAPVTDFFVAEGQALADRDSIIRTEMSGDIVEVTVAKGDDVSAGDILGRLDATQVYAEFKRAEATHDRAEREFRNAEALLERGTATLDRAEDARAALAAAVAQLEAARQGVDRTFLAAPFDGRVEDLAIDNGEFFGTGEEVARIVDLEPLTVRARVPQQSLRRLAAGQRAAVAFITGEERDGTVRFVGTSADPETRTFLLEVEIPNADRSIPAGISAEIRIPTGEMAAHFVSPAILTLSENGALGVKTVDDDSVVGFMEATIVRAERDGIWIGGLPASVRIITVGQGFVRPGDVVAPKIDSRPRGGAAVLPQ